MRVVSGVQPTGNLHLGNYLGAIKNWVNLQDQAECFFFVADMHALTQPIAPDTLHRNVGDMLAMLIACGIDPNKSILFPQHRVREHAELQWILTCTARMGWLNRMTQYKDKGGEDRFEIFRAGWNMALGFNGPHGDVDLAWETFEKTNEQRPSVGAGVFAYPVLQAADVLLYDATHVPVGDDQDQHLQLAREIASKFNADKGAIFTNPKALYSGPATRVMSLKNGYKKMSKSDPDDMTRINLMDDAALITKKVKRAVTDTSLLPTTKEGLEGRPEVSNLINCYAAITDRSVEDVLQELGGQGHGVMKGRLADAIVSVVEPIQQAYRTIHPDVFKMVEPCVEKAAAAARTKMIAVRKAVYG